MFCGISMLMAACGGESRRPAQTASADLPAGVDTANSATESIAEARCAREDRCTNIGSEKKYSTTQDCLSRIRDEWKDDLNARECPNGVNRSELEECLAQVRDEECSSPLATLE